MRTASILWRCRPLVSWNGVGLRRASSATGDGGAHSLQRRKVGPGPAKSSGRAAYPGAHCWSCEHVFNADNSVFCSGCKKLLQDVPQVNYFQLLNLPVSLYVDREALERNFQNLQRQVHPDRFVSKSKEEQSIAMARSASASEAYATLKDPMARARYVLAMRGIDLEKCSLEDPELLMEVMEEREALEAAKRDGSGQVVRAAELRYQTEIDDSLRAAEDLLQAHGDSALTPVTHLIIRVQYYNKLLVDARGLAGELEQFSQE